MALRDDVEAVIEGVRAGRILETFERWYADDVEMSENGVATTRGKEANRERETGFVGGVEWHGADVHAVLVDGDRAAVEWTLHFTPKGGDRVALRQVGIQTWRDGRIVREAFYHG
jgi:hypothetical protein